MKPYFQADGCVIYNADARDVLPTLPDRSVDLVMTDPPYGINWADGNDLSSVRHQVFHQTQRKAITREIANDSSADANELVRWMFGQSVRLLDRGCLCCCCTGGGGPNPMFAHWTLMMDEIFGINIKHRDGTEEHKGGFVQAVVWRKPGLGLGIQWRRSYEFVLVAKRPGGPSKWRGGKKECNVVEARKILAKEWQHPTEKPVGLMSYFINLYSDPEDIVLDPFMGRGATLIAARDSQRRAIGIESDERWCESAAKRLDQMSLLVDATPGRAGLSE
ncbi:MAG: hypothetical protein GF400_09665 [Candidatus Eisenbacteria bacterium]|nr:hypothetical protein [Candidatus Eisenbacteria bacterium]